MDNVELALTRMFLSTDAGIVSDACAIKCLKLIPTTKVSTAATDGVVLLYNPDFVARLTIHQVIGLLVHEVCHVRFQHNERFAESGWVDHDRANRAMDMEINPIVDTAGYILPPDGCWPYQIGEENGKSWEEYYAVISGMNKPEPEPEPEPDAESQSGSGSEAAAGAAEPGAGEPAETEPSEPAGAPEKAESGEPGEAGGEPEAGASEASEAAVAGQAGEASGQPETVRPGAHAAGSLVEAFAPELLDEQADAESLASEVADQIQDASAQSKMQMPGEVQRHKAGQGSGCQQLVASELVIATDCRWQDVVIEMIGQRASGQTIADWSKPHRRSLSSGVYRPSRRRVTGFKLALVIDVSGSCVSFFSAWQALAREMLEAIPDIIELAILYHDDAIVKRDEWHRRDGDEVSVSCRGGGGTSHRQVLAEVESLDVDGCVLFTDSESYWPESFSVDCVTVQPPGSYATTPFGTNVRITKW